jgi:hypothetical protein
VVSRRREEAELTRAKVDLSAFLAGEAHSWLEELEKCPDPLLARRALVFSEDRLREPPSDPEMRALLERIQDRAGALLAD